MRRKIDFSLNLEDKSHQITESDTIESICELYAVSLESLLDANNMTHQDMINFVAQSVGSVITVPMVGDLSLGLAKRDNEGNLQYIYPDGSVSTKPALDNQKGKLIRDIAYTRDHDAVKQVIFNRLKTDAPDWYHHPKMGGNLSDLIGEPNTRETGELGADLITRALIYGDFLRKEGIWVRPVPVNTEEILFMVTIDMGEDTPLQIPIMFDLRTGLKEA